MPTIPNTEILAYEATAEPHLPVCVTGCGGGLSVNLYRGFDGLIVGVAIFDNDGEYLGGVGLIPEDCR